MATVNNKDFVVKNGLVVSTTATVEGHYNSYSTSSGALVVQGGAGIAGNLYVGGTINATKLVVELTTVTQTLVQSPDKFEITNTTASTSTTTGALVVCGGVGIGGALNVGKEANFHGTATFYDGVTTQGAISAPSFNITTSSGSITFGDGSIQTTRAGVLWTNCSIIAAAGAAGICTGCFVLPTTCGGQIAVGDMYYDNTVGALYIMINQGCGNVQFNPIF